MSETVCLKTYGSREEAEFDRDMLAGAGIRTMVSADDCGGMRPDLAFTSGGVKLLVLAENLQRATALLQTSDEGQDGPQGVAVDEVRLIAEQGTERFEIVEGVGEGFYVYRWVSEVSTHDYLQSSVEIAKQTALEEWGVPLEAWRLPRPGERTLFHRDRPA